LTPVLTAPIDLETAQAQIRQRQTEGIATAAVAADVEI
jgi:hypothetical protein